jgi:hypothetical protein
MMFRHREDFRIQNLKSRNYSGYKIHASDVINHTTQRITTSAETVFSDRFFTGSSAAFVGIFLAHDCRNRTTKLEITTKVQENAHFQPKSDRSDREDSRELQGYINR